MKGSDMDGGVRDGGGRNGGERAGAGWTADRVKEMMAAAALVYWRTPGLRGPAGYRSCMPAVLRNPFEAHNPDDRRAPVRPPAPSPEQQWLLDRVELWLRQLPPAWYRIVWARAFHDSRLAQGGWRRIGQREGMAAETARYKYGHAINRLVEIVASSGISPGEIPKII